MELMTDLKTELLKELDDARDLLWIALNLIDPAFEFQSGQTKRDIFAHIAGWESLVFEAFREYLYRVPARAYPYSGVDAANADFVSKRQGLSAVEAQRECEINRFAIKTMLSTIPAERFDDLIRFPWGQESITDFLRGAIKHEREH